MISPLVTKKQGSATWPFLFVLLVIVAALADEDAAAVTIANNTKVTGGNDNTTVAGDNSNNNNCSQSPPPSAFFDNQFDSAYYRHRQPPWGVSSYGNNVYSNHSKYFAAGGAVLDVVRPGWSWSSQRQKQLVAPFCYDTIPNAHSSCPTGDVQDKCRSVLQGTPGYSGRFCLTDQPHTIIGPVCWNETCYGEETRQACELVDNGWFIGGSNFGSYFLRSPDKYIELRPLDLAWCVVPGDDHTLFGPACYGSDCYTTELIAACQTLNGTNFADRFCLLHDKSYTVVGPVCRPADGTIENATECYGEETAQVCAELGGISVGDIFCILTSDNYSVLGPFCASGTGETESDTIYSHCVSAEEGKSACEALSGRTIGNGTFCILNDSNYHLLGPTCDHGRGCAVFTEDYVTEDYGVAYSCQTRFGGKALGDYYCIIQGDYTVVGPSQYGRIDFGGGDNILAKNVDENSVHEVFGSWNVLNGTYSVYGPTCQGSSCYEGNCVEAGGSLIDSIFCVMKMESTSSADPSVLWWPRSRVAAVAVTAAGCLFVALSMII